jgi:hypothetical protein
MVELEGVYMIMDDVGRHKLWSVPYYLLMRESETSEKSVIFLMEM